MRRAAVLPMALTLSLAVVQVTLAMAQGRVVRDVLYHPTAENIPEVIDPRFILTAEGGVEMLPEADYTTVMIGVENGEYDEMFGALEDLAIVGDGTYLTVDKSNSEVRSYDYRGALLGSFGSAGDGPGEFGNHGPLRIEVTDDGKMACVLDWHFVNCFERVARGQFAFKRKFRLQIFAKDMCMMGGHIYLLGHWNFEQEDRNGIIHKLDFEGNSLQVFGEPYKATHPYHITKLSREGRIACSKRHSLVGVIRMNMPILTAYTSNGEIAWRVKFDDVEPVKIATGSYKGSPLYYWTDPKVGQSQFDALFTDTAGDFYVHYSTSRTGVEDEPKYGPMFKITGQTGDGEYLGRADRVVGVDGDYVFTMRTHPFSQIQIHKRSQGTP